MASALSLQKHQRLGPRARIGHLHELEQGGDIGLVRAIGEEGLAKIEDDVRFESLDTLERELYVVEDSQRLDLVAQLAQAGEDVGLRRFLLFVAQRMNAEGLVGADPAVHVEEDENAHHTDLLNRPV